MKYDYIQLYNSYRNYPTKFLKYTQFTRYTCSNICLNTKKTAIPVLISKSLLLFCLIIPFNLNGKPISNVLFSAKYKLTCL